MLGLSFLGLFVGAFLVMPPFFAYLYYVQEPEYNANGELKPEERMAVAIIGALLVFDLSLLVQMDITHERALDCAHYWFKPVQYHRITTIREYPYTFPYPPIRLMFLSPYDRMRC